MLVSLAKYKKTKEDREHRLLTSMLPMNLYMQGHTHTFTQLKRKQKNLKNSFNSTPLPQRKNNTNRVRWEYLMLIAVLQGHGQFLLVRKRSR